jgi:hypothetical protein
VPSNIEYDDAGVPLCGTAACDLKSNQCCLTQNLQTLTATCVPQSMSCPSGAAVFQCAQETDCSQGKVCCASGDTTNPAAPTAGSSCQTLTNGACTPSDTATTASAQLCQTNAECKNGMACTWQDCTVGTELVSLTMCGIQSPASGSQSAFHCSAHQ